MAKDDTLAASSAPVIEAPQEVTLDEFCMRASATDKRVELLGAFHHVELKAGHMKDIESAYADRYSAFINKPV